MPEGGIPLERQLELLEEELRRAQRFAALGELASTTTHEFNNVLTTIINYAKLGLRHKDEPTATRPSTRFSTPRSGPRRSPTACSAWPATAAPTGRRPTWQSWSKSRSCCWSARCASIACRSSCNSSRRRRHWCAAIRSSRCCLNLLTNARQAMPKGGRVLIRVAPDAAAGTVDLTIRDTGSGIPAEQLPQIFDRFYTTKRGPDASGKGGTGVGLSMCREIIEQHQGKIRVESTRRRRHRLHAQAAGRPRRNSSSHVRSPLPSSAFPPAATLSTTDLHCTLCFADSLAACCMARLTDSMRRHAVEPGVDFGQHSWLPAPGRGPATASAVKRACGSRRRRAWWTASRVVGKGGRPGRGPFRMRQVFQLLLTITSTKKPFASGITRTIALRRIV